MSSMRASLSVPLLQRVAAGDTEAVAACIDQFAGLVWSLARRILRCPSEAEDAVQEVFIDLWKSASRFDPSVASETTFVAMIARRRLIDRQRRKAGQPETEPVSIDELALAGPDEPPRIDLQDEVARAAGAIQQLKPEQRRVLQLAVCHGWPHQLIAERLALPLGTVKTHVRRGLIRVREELEAQRSNSITEVERE